MVSVTFQVIYLLIIFLLRVSNGDLQYKCEAGDGDKVQITISKTTNNFTTQTLKMLDVTCKPSSNDSDFILKECPADTNIPIEFMKEETHHVLMRKNVQIYTLNCHWDKKPVSKNVSAAAFYVTGPPATTPSIHIFQKDWAPTLEMTVNPHSDVIMGQTLKVKISSKETKYKFAPQECTATSGSNSHVLWKSENCKSGDKDLFGFGNWTFVNNSEIVITHDLEAFRFAGSHTLDLGCTVKICPEGMEDQCTLSCTDIQAPTPTPAPAPAPVRRRRRDIHPRTTAVQTTLNVADSFQDFPNSGSGPFLATSLVSTAVIMYSMVL